MNRAPIFDNPADAERYERDMRWVHAKAMIDHGGDHEDAIKWVQFVWRTKPDAVERAIIATVVQLIEDSQRAEFAPLVRTVTQRHNRVVQTPSQLLRGAA